MGEGKRKECEKRRGVNRRGLEEGKDDGKKKEHMTGKEKGKN